MTKKKKILPDLVEMPKQKSDPVIAPVSVPVTSTLNETVVEPRKPRDWEPPPVV